MEKSVKIVFLITVFKGAGVERNIVNLANYFDKTKYQVLVAAGRIEGDFKDQLNKDVELIDFNAPSVLFLFFSLVRFLRKEKPDILVSALPHVNIICIVARIFSGVKTKIVLTEHSILSLLPHTARTAWRRFVARFILPHFVRLFYPFADSIVCVSKAVAKDLSKVISRSDKIKIIYNPVVGKNMYSLSKEPLAEDSLFFDKDIPVILAVGRLVKAKNYPNLFRALKIVLNRKPVRLIILGEGPEEKKLKNYAAELGISKSVSFLGFKKNPYKYMASSSVFVISSIREGFGNAIVEAMALGLPVIATDCGGPREIIEDAKSGILVPPDNDKSLAGDILKVLESLSLSQKFSSEGLERAQNFTVEKSVQEYEKVFKEVLTQKI